MSNLPLEIKIKPTLMSHLSWIFMGTIMIIIGSLGYGKTIKGIDDSLLSNLFSILLIVIGVFMLIKWVMVKTVVVKEDGLEVSSVFGLSQRTIPRSHITSFIEREKSGESSNWKECTIHTSYGAIKLSEQMHAGYTDLIQIIRDKWQVKEDKIALTKEISKNNLVQGILNISIGVALLFAVRQIDALYDILPKSELQEIKGVVANNLGQSLGDTEEKSMSILLGGYPGFNFQIDRNAQSAIKKSDFDQVVAKGDSIILSISKHDFQNKLTPGGNLSIWEKNFNFHNINIYGLRNNAMTLLNPVDYYSMAESHDQNDGWNFSSFIYLISLFSIIGGGKKIYTFVKGAA